MLRPSVMFACVIAGTIALGATGADRQAKPAQPPQVVSLVRAALAHGDLAGARRVAEATKGDEAAQQLAIAIIEIFEGKREPARGRLTPLAQMAPSGEAALELGLLDLYEGKRAEGYKRLAPLVAVRQFSGPDSYLLLARAARASREYMLAADAFTQVAKESRADIQTERGDLFLERHRPGDAATDYKAALSSDPRWVPALVGLARAFADDDPEAAKKALDAAVSIAPNHPLVLETQAQRGLDEEDVAGAEAALDKLAQARPNSIEEAGLRVAVAYQKLGLTGVEPAVERLRAINPNSALGYRQAGLEAARDYRFDEAVAFAQRAVAVDAGDPFAQFELGLYLMRTGDEVKARTALDTSWELDKSARVTKNLLDLLDRLEKFKMVRSGPFIFKFSPEEAEVLQVYAVPLADQAYKEMVTRYGFTPQGPILVEVFPVHDDFAVRTLGLPGLEGALGACFGRVVTMDSPRAHREKDFSWQATLWHELAHVFTLQLSQYRVPRWLTEGISTYEEHRRRAAWGRELTLEFAHLLGKGKTFGVKKLPDAFKHPETLSLAYFEASLVVEHLVALNGDAGLRTLLQAYAAGATDEQAFEKAFGKSVDIVDASFAAFINERYGNLRNAMGDPPSQVARDNMPALRQRAAAAPNNFISQLELGRALLRNGDAAGARPVLEKAAQLAPPATGADSPKMLLAKIAVDQGDVTRARRELRELLVTDHTNIAAARQLDSLARGAGALDDETYALRFIADLDPFDADTHGLLGRRILDKDPAAALIEFQAAVALGPVNLAEAHTDVAEAFLKLNRKDDAKKSALLALKEAPTFARAQDLLLIAIGRQP